MDFTEAVRTCFQKYAVFSGRASRSEYWWWRAFIVLANVALTVAGVIIGFSYLSSLFSLVTFVPDLVVSVRRFHDTGRSGWYILAATVTGILAVVVGAFAMVAIGGAWPLWIGGAVSLGAVGYLFVVSLLASEDGTNEYGPEPGVLSWPPASSAP